MQSKIYFIFLAAKLRPLCGMKSLLNPAENVKEYMSGIRKGSC